MKYSNPFLTAGTLLALCAALLLPVADAQAQENVRTAGGASYVSGGVGEDSIARLNALAKDFNVKLVFAMKSGDYVSDVGVSIADGKGKTLIDTKSQGPWFLTRLPAGNYQVVATFAGKAEQRTISVGGADKLRTIDFRWSSE